MASASEQAVEKHRKLRTRMYHAAVLCISAEDCGHVDEVACTEAWFTAMRNASPKRSHK